MAGDSLADAREILASLGMPRAQQNDRSAVCLLALLDLGSGKSWAQAGSPLMGITPIMEWVRNEGYKDYAPNTRETVRRQTVHQFIAAGIALPNPDDPTRSVNSPHTVYQIAPDVLALLRSYGTRSWRTGLAAYLGTRETLAAQYARERQQTRIPVRTGAGKALTLSPGGHSELIRAIVEDFGPRFVPGGILVYVGDTGAKWAHFDEPLLTKLGVEIDSHGKMPDVVLYDGERNWLVLVEAVTSHGPVDGKRHAELERLFDGAEAGAVYVTAFPSRAAMAKYVGAIAWETDVWVADAPSHLIHFNGSRFLGPYSP